MAAKNILLFIIVSLKFILKLMTQKYDGEDEVIMKFSGKS
jgi:hypothetical protein